MVEWGMTPMQAIAAATVTAARVLGDLGAGLGAIARGSFADIVAVEGDPLAGIAPARGVSFVMKGGAVWRMDGSPVAR